MQFYKNRHLHHHCHSDLRNIFQVFNVQAEIRRYNQNRFYLSVIYIGDPRFYFGNEHKAF